MASLSNVAPNNAIVCSYDYLAPGTPGGSNTGPTTVNFTGTTGATNDSNPANNVSNDSATIIDALNDATSLPGGSTGQTFNLAGNDEFPPGSTFTIQPGSTCANPGVSLAGVATFDVTPSPCTVNYRVCAPAPNGTVCDTAVLTVTGTTTDMQAVLGPIPSVVSPGQSLPGLTLTCTNIGSNPAVNASCVPAADVGTVGVGLTSPHGLLALGTWWREAADCEPVLRPDCQATRLVACRLAGESAWALLVTASDVHLLGIGSAFWGFLAGALIHALLRRPSLAPLARRTP